MHEYYKNVTMLSVFYLLLLCLILFLRYFYANISFICYLLPPKSRLMEILISYVITIPRYMNSFIYRHLTGF